MPIMSENPCASGHPELKLLLEVTSFSDRLPVMHCRRCGENLPYEQAIRNDERLKVTARLVERVQVEAKTASPALVAHYVTIEAMHIVAQHDGDAQRCEVCNERRWAQRNPNKSGQERQNFDADPRIPASVPMSNNAERS